MDAAQKLLDYIDYLRAQVLALQEKNVAMAQKLMDLWAQKAAEFETKLNAVNKKGGEEPPV